jgi:hypothetical protein
MYIRSILLMVCLALVMPSFSCASEGQSPINKRLELQLEKAPRLNETVKLSCLRTVSIRSTNDNISYENITLEIERIDPKTRHVVCRSAVAGCAGRGQPELGG